MKCGSAACRVFCLWLAMLVAAAPAFAAVAEGGYLASFAPQPRADGRHELREVARTDAGPGNRHRELDPSRDWHVRWLDAAGRVLRESAIPDPTRPLIGSHDPSQPLQVRFADHPSALLAEVRDAGGRLRGEIPLDAGSRTRAERLRVATMQHLGAATRLARKRAGDPPAHVDEARRALARQVAVQERLQQWREAKCAPYRRGLPIPEQAGDPCLVQAAVGAAPRTTGRLASVATPLAKPPFRPLAGEAVAPGKLLPLHAPKADQVTLTGKLLFAGSGPLPAEPITLYSWGAPGAGFGYVLTAAPPDFTFSSPVNIGADVDLQVVAPAPFLAVTVDLGIISVDTHRDVTLERGATVSGRLVFPPGSTPPAEDLWLYVTDSRGQESVRAVPPEFEYRFAVPFGSPVSVSLYPPEPFLYVSADWGIVSADTVRDLPVPRGVVVSGQVTFPPGTPAATEPFWIWLYGMYGDPEQAGAFQVSPPDFRFSQAVPPGRLALAAQPPAPFLADTLDLGEVGVDTEVAIPLRRGVVLSGRARFVAGAAKPTQPFTMVVWDYEVTNSGFGVQLSPPDFSFVTVVEPGASRTLELRPPVPFVAREVDVGPLDADRAIDVVVQRGILLNGHVTGPTDYSVVVRDLATGEWPRYHSFGTPAFQVAVPPSDVTVEVLADGFRPSAPWHRQGAADVEVDFVLQASAAASNVALTLLDGGGQPLPQARAEAWQAGRHVTSALSDASGRAELRLGAGTYDIKVRPDTEQANWDWNSTKLFAEPALVASVTVAGAVERTLQVPASAWMDMRVALPTESPFPGCSSNLPTGRLELLRDGKVVARGGMRWHGAMDGGGHRLVTGPGIFEVRFTMPGNVVYESGPFRPAPGRTIALTRVGSDPAMLWTGTLRNVAGTPVANRTITLGDELGIQYWPACEVRTSATGRFALPLCRDCDYTFLASTVDGSQRRTLRATGPLRGSREQDVRMGAALPMAALAPSGATRVFGRADAPFKLVFLAEGYVAERETWTDSNGNGVWDGVQWVDVDVDGAWDEGEPYWIYGTASAPVAGQDPRAGNEVIQDLNGDGVLSIDDRALFERNVRDYLRALFSSHEFDVWRGAYQASAVMAYSAQAGMDHGAFQRDTLFDASFSPDRGLIGIDYGTASQAAAAASPGYTVVVVMINQPVPYGRVNSFVLASGGVAVDPNDQVGAHEFGHNPGGLADEYSEFPETWYGQDFYSPNSTRYVERAHVAWGDWVPPADDGAPTRPWMGRDGFFEGSSYRVSGAFRPSHASVMRGGSLLFNNASKDQLRRVHAGALRDWPGRMQITGDQDGCTGFRVSWDVAGLGVAAVELRGGTHDGQRVGSGPAAGSATVRPGHGDLYLVDAATGVVLDIGAEPIVRCTQGDRGAKPEAPPAASPAPPPPPAIVTPMPREPSPRHPGTPSREPRHHR